MAELNDLPKAYQGLARYLGDMQLIRPDVYKDLMDKQGPDRIGAVQKIIETDMKRSLASQGEGRLLPDWLPDAVRPAAEIASEKAEKRTWDDLVSARRDLEKYKTDLTQMEKARTAIAKTYANSPLPEIHLVEGDAKAQTGSPPAASSPVANTEKAASAKDSTDYSILSKDNLGGDPQILGVVKQDLKRSEYFHAGEPKAYEKALQRQLNAKYNANLVVDGDVGPLTRAAFKTSVMGIPNANGEPTTSAEMQNFREVIADKARVALHNRSAETPAQLAETAETRTDKPEAQPESSLPLATSRRNYMAFPNGIPEVTEVHASKPAVPAPDGTNKPTVEHWSDKNGNRMTRAHYKTHDEHGKKIEVTSTSVVTPNGEARQTDSVSHGKGIFKHTDQVSSIITNKQSDGSTVVVSDMERNTKGQLAEQKKPGDTNTNTILASAKSKPGGMRPGI